MLKLDNFSALNAMNSKSMNINTKVDDIKLREQTDRFEAVFLKILLDTSLKDDSGLFPKEPGREIYNSMRNEAIAESSSGNFGYSKLLYDFLKEQEKMGKVS